MTFSPDLTDLETRHQRIDVLIDMLWRQEIGEFGATLDSMSDSEARELLRTCLIHLSVDRAAKKSYRSI